MQFQQQLEESLISNVFLIFLRNTRTLIQVSDLLNWKFFEKKTLFLKHCILYSHS